MITRLPCRVMSGSATPRPSTRWRMMSFAFSTALVGRQLAVDRLGLEDDREAALQVEAELRFVAGGDRRDRPSRATRATMMMSGVAMLRLIGRPSLLVRRRRHGRSGSSPLVLDGGRRRSSRGHVALADVLVGCGVSRRPMAMRAMRRRTPSATSSVTISSSRSMIDPVDAGARQDVVARLGASETMACCARTRRCWGRTSKSHNGMRRSSGSRAATNRSRAGDRA